MILLFFWDANAPVAPPPPVPPEPGTGAHVRSNQKIGQPIGKLPVGNGKTVQYEPMSLEQWDAREAYLRSLMPPEPPPPPVPDLAVEYDRQANAAYELRRAKIEELNTERAFHVQELRHCTTCEEMLRHGKRIEAINDKIHELTGAQAVHRFMH